MKYLLKQYEEGLFELIGQCKRGKNEGKYHLQGKKYSLKGLRTRFDAMPNEDTVDFNGIEIIIKQHLCKMSVNTEIQELDSRSDAMEYFGF